MKYLLILSILTTCTSVFAQKSTTLWLNQEGIILKGTIDVQSVQPLFVGHEYEFTIMSNNSEFDLIIDSENLTVVLDEFTKKTTGGLLFKITPIDTGMCSLALTLGKNKERKASLISREFTAINYPQPPLFIGNHRSGESIVTIDENAELSCKYDPAYGIFKSYPVKTWKAKLGDLNFSGKGTKLSKDFIEAVNQFSGVLILTVELSKNETGYKEVEAVYLIK
ncbi:MAG: hypothetical protein ACO1N0_00740 [Fluviicola sp.]